jgi:tetratricopeptide (TPR) repeat protein
MKKWILFCFLSIWILIGVESRAQLQPPQPQVTEDQLAFKFYQQRDFTKALPLFQNLYETKGGNYFYTYYLQCLMELRNYKDAIKLVKKESRKSNDPMRIKVDLGYVYNYAGELDNAKEEFDDAIKMLEKMPQQVSNLANQFRARNLNEYALKTYEKGRSIIGNQTAYALEIAGIYEATGEFRKMVDAFLEIIGTDPNQLSSIQSRIQYYLSQFDEEEYRDYLRTALLKKIQKQPDEKVFTEMMYWFSIQQGDYEMAYKQAVSFEKRFNENGNRMLSLAKLSADNEYPEIALKCLKSIIASGKTHPLYVQATSEWLKTRFQIVKNAAQTDTAEVAKLGADFANFLTEQGQTPATIDVMRQLASLYAYYLQKGDEAVELLEKILTFGGLLPELNAKVKLELGDIYVFSDDIWQGSLLYAQVDKAMPGTPIGEEAKFRYARLMYYAGEFHWAMMHLEILRGAVERLIANDSQVLYLFINNNLEDDSTGGALVLFGRAELLAFQKKYDLALVTLDSIPMMFLTHSILDDVAFKKAEICEMQKDYASADSLYKKAAEFWPDGLLADDALYKRALLLDNVLNNKLQAMELYEKILINYPGSFYVDEARKRFRFLRDGQPLN